MGSYLNKSRVNSPRENEKLAQPLLSLNTLMWLRKQLWAWILLGFFVMSVFFYIAKGLIVFIGGTFLGMYMYNIYGKDNKGDNNQVQNINNTLLNHTMKYVKSGINGMTQEQPEQIEGFEGYKLFSNVWWKNSRV